MKKTTFVLALAVMVTAMLYSARFADKGYRVGDVATDFTLKNVDGKMVSMADNKDAKGYIVVFSCNTCPVVKQYESRIIDLHQKYASRGFPVIAINPNDPGVSPGDSYAEMQKRAKNLKFPFAYLFDETQEIARTYGATNTPHVYVVTREGDQFRVAYIGAIDNNARNADAADKKYVENAVDELLAGKEVSVPSAKAVGCTIKWRGA
jgi:peroxiredoxin